MLNQTQSSPSRPENDREARLTALVEQLRPNAESILRQMAQRLVDLPEEESFGQVELDLRDLAHDLACSAHQTALRVGKKRAT